MKKEIHPKYFPKAKVKCACGKEFTFGSTKPEIQVELCSSCHPFYTGKANLIDTAGRIERFKARKEKASTKPIRKKTEKKAQKRDKKSQTSLPAGRAKTKK